MTRFLHTADWQLGKPFAGVADAQKRALLIQQRVAAVDRLSGIAEDRGVAFVVVAGDVFDSAQPSRHTVAAGLSAIGQIKRPVYVIPGNHDHGGGGSLWEDPHFLREASELAPNLQILVQRKPAIAPGAVLFPCPLLQRQEPQDPTTWLRTGPEGGDWDPKLPRVVLAHGSVQGFGINAFGDDEEAGGEGVNRIELDRIPAGEFDYIALGDWHGTKQVAAKAWYSGTPEIDRFPKGGDHDPGNALLVSAERGQSPIVEKIPTHEITWSDIEWEFIGDMGLGAFRERVADCVAQRVDRDLLRLRLRGALGLAQLAALEQCIESWRSRLIRLGLDNSVAIVPSVAEMEALTQRHGDPLVARVATRLSTLAQEPGESGQWARLALRQLHQAVAAR